MTAKENWSKSFLTVREVQFFSNKKTSQETVVGPTNEKKKEYKTETQTDFSAALKVVIIFLFVR